MHCLEWNSGDHVLCAAGTIQLHQQAEGIAKIKNILHFCWHKIRIYEKVFSKEEKGKETVTYLLQADCRLIHHRKAG